MLTNLRNTWRPRNYHGWGKAAPVLGGLVLQGRGCAGAARVRYHTGRIRRRGGGRLALVCADAGRRGRQEHVPQASLRRLQIGSKTGVPFGAYHYTAGFQPQLLNVPFLIPLAWLMMPPPAWAVAQRLTRHVSGRSRSVAFVLVSALAFTAWDLYLDPQVVHWELWVWEQPGAYFGIPLVNYPGWLVVYAIITAAVRPPVLPERPLLLVYTLTWLIEATGLVLFWRLYGPAVAGFAGMGIFVLAAWTACSRGRKFAAAAVLKELS